MDVTKSVVIQLLDLVWENANSSSPFSYERLNHSMRDAVSLAIGSGMTFAVDDVEYIVAHYRSGYWVGSSSEWMYSEAIAVENSSAYESYEKAFGRTGIIADDVSIESRSGYTHGSSLRRQKSRLAVGSKFPWKGQQVSVTSFSTDQQSVTACSYKPQKEGEYQSKVDRRYSITRDNIIAERKEAKVREDLLLKLTEIGKANGDSLAITKALGCHTKEDYYRLPLPKIEKVLKTLQAKVVPGSRGAASRSSPIAPVMKGAI